MLKLSKTIISGAILAAAAAAAPSLYAQNAPTPPQSQSGETTDQGMMGGGHGQHGMMDGQQGMMGGDQGRQGMMEHGNGGQQGMMGGKGIMNMMNMMTQMNKMMETCNRMMESHMDRHDGTQHNGQKQAPATPNNG